MISHRIVDEGEERAAKSISGTITNNQIQNYYKNHNNKKGLTGGNHPSTKALFMNSHPFSNYKPLPD